METTDEFTKFRNQNIIDRVWELQLEIDILKEIYRFQTIEDLLDKYDEEFTKKSILIEDKTIYVLNINIDIETQIKLRIIAREYGLLVSYNIHKNNKKDWY